MADAAAAGDDGTDCPRYLVYFRHYVKMGKRIGDFEGASEKFLIARAEGAGVIVNKIFDHGINVSYGLLCFFGRELTIGSIVREVLKNFFDVFLAFQDARPKVFIRRNDNKILGVSQVSEEFVLERRQVRLSSTSLKVCPSLLEKVGDSGTKFDGDGSRVRLPVGTDEKLFWVVDIRSASEHHLSVDVAAKAVCNFCKVLRSSRIDWLWAEVQTKPEQRLKMRGRVQACTEIVAGEVAGAREE
jgi:hypothetical protein